MRKTYLKLTKEQKSRGVIFSSVLRGSNPAVLHEVMNTDPDKYEKIDRLKNDRFFNSCPYYTHNEIRTA